MEAKAGKAGPKLQRAVDLGVDGGTTERREHDVLPLECFEQRVERYAKERVVAAVIRVVPVAIFAIVRAAIFRGLFAWNRFESVAREKLFL